MTDYLLYTAVMSVICVFTVAFFVAPAVMVLARSAGWTDDPKKSIRKIHKDPVPYLGGVAIWIGFMASLVAFFVFFPEFRRLIAFWKTLASYITGSFLILLIGTADDVFDIPPVRKLIAQIVVAVLVVIGGVKINGEILLLGAQVSGVAALFLSVLIIVVSMNVINLVDGVDGLAGSVVVIGALVNLWVAFRYGNIQTVLLCALLASSVIGFLRHNWFRAKLFLGDGGSLLLGFLLGGVIIRNINDAVGVVGSIVPLSVLIYPLFDVLVTVVRRIVSGKPVMRPDGAHVHHRLINLGVRHDLLVIMVGVFSVLFIAMIYIMSLKFYSLAMFCAVFWGLIFLFGVRKLGLFDFKRLRLRIGNRYFIKKYNSRGDYIIEKIKQANSIDAVIAIFKKEMSSLDLESLRYLPNSWNDHEMPDGLDKEDDYMSLHLTNSGGTIFYRVKQEKRLYFQADIELVMVRIVNVLDKLICGRKAVLMQLSNIKDDIIEKKSTCSL
jgi:UDP-GlcNAc:undecaprenyl-phosphate/decaprenyl-phosphate GlcNAc-1-phosphate transferase